MVDGQLNYNTRCARERYEAHTRGREKPRVLGFAARVGQVTSQAHNLYANVIVNVEESSNFSKVGFMFLLIIIM